MKEKNSNNIDNIKIMEKYNTELASFTNTDECVSALYEEKRAWNQPTQVQIIVQHI